MHTNAAFVKHYPIATNSAGWKKILWRQTALNIGFAVWWLHIFLLFLIIKMKQEDIILVLKLLKLWQACLLVFLTTTKILCNTHSFVVNQINPQNCSRFCSRTIIKNRINWWNQIKILCIVTERGLSLSIIGTAFSKMVSVLLILKISVKKLSFLQQLAKTQKFVLG